MVLQWSDVGWMAQDEYYVIRIPYNDAGGVAEFWRKEKEFQVPSNYSQNDVGFADRHYNWSVQVLRCTANCDKISDDNVKKQGVAVGSRSEERTFYWHSDISGGDGSPPDGGTAVPTTTVPTPPS